MNLEELESVWFNPSKFYSEGYPHSMMSVLYETPEINELLQELLAEYESALEIGPGEIPVIEKVTNREYFDISPRILRGKEKYTIGDVTKGLPFSDNLFDVVVLCDILTHIKPEKRRFVLEESMRVGKHVLLFEYTDYRFDKPIPRVESQPNSLVDVSWIRKTLEELGSVEKEHQFDYTLYTNKKEKARVFLATSHAIF